MQLSNESELIQSSTTETALEAVIDEQKEQIRQLLAEKRETNEYIQVLQHELEQRSNEAAESAERLREAESELAEIQQQQQQDVAAAVVVRQQMPPDEQPGSSKSVQTEQSAALEVEKELNRQLMIREWNMTQYIQMLQNEVEKRCCEAVVSAARLREVELQLSEIRPPETPLSTAEPQQHPDDKPKHKSKILGCIYIGKNRNTSLWDQMVSCRKETARWLPSQSSSQTTIF